MWSNDEKVNIILAGAKIGTQVTELCRSYGISANVEKDKRRKKKFEFPKVLV